MFKFTISLSLAVFLVTSSVFAGEDSEVVEAEESSGPPVGLIPERDEWWKIGRTFTDLPRVFDLKNGCPADIFYLDCNICHCFHGKGPALCHLMGCAPTPQIVNWENGKSCPAGRSFYWKCNDCHCSPNGTEAACTKKACPSPNDAENKPESGKEESKE